MTLQQTETILIAFNESLQSICSCSKREPLIYIRQCYIYLLWDKLNMKQQDIADYLNIPSHTTVLHSIRMVQGEIDLYKSKNVSLIRKKIHTMMINIYNQINN